MSGSGIDRLDTSTPERKRAAYVRLRAQLAALIEGERDSIANLAQAAALVFQTLPGLNWAGFYLLKNGGLVVGPFQGKVACARIDMGRGVCGTAAASRSIQIVRDVHAFPGHIACDSDSASEIVLPMELGGRLLGVFDLDSPILGRFDDDDAVGLSGLLDVLLAGTEWK